MVCLPVGCRVADAGRWVLVREGVRLRKERSLGTWKLSGDKTSTIIQHEHSIVLLSAHGWN